MKKLFDIDNLNQSDFYFNGHWLSEFYGSIAGKNGTKLTGTFVTMENKTEKVLGRDGELFYDSKYNPRSFTVPVIFKDVESLKQITPWLMTKTPQNFYYDNDEVKCVAKVDNIDDIESGYIETKIGILFEIKFIAYDPYLYAINDIKHILKSPSNTIFNRGNKESYPLIKLYGNGSLTIGINGNAITINNVVDYIYVDTLYLTCYKTNDDDLMDNVNGKLEDIYLESGKNSISLSTNIISAEIQCRSRWI